MQKKPILFISPLPPPQGGIAVWTQKIMRMGLPDDTPMTLVDTRIRGNRNIFDAAFFSRTEIWRTLRIYFLLLYQLLSKRPGLIHLNSSLSTVGVVRDLGCVLLANLFRIPVVTHYHGNMQDFNMNRLRGFSGKILRLLMRLSVTNIVANTPSLQCAKSFSDPEKLILLPNFIEDSIFTQTKPMLTRPRLRALYAGGITTAKGCAEILAMAKHFPQIDFHLFGKMHTDMAPLYQHVPANLILQGEVPHDVLLQAMRESDFLLFPSYTEGFPLTVLEAMAIGLAVIATKVGGIPEMIIDGKGGYLVQPRDSVALSHALQALINQPQQISAMGQYNKQKSYAEYRYSAVTTRLLAIYNQQLGNAACAV